jgi:hypothetical protein
LAKRYPDRRFELLGVSAYTNAPPGGLFHEAKGRLGFDDPPNRTERAVERLGTLTTLRRASWRERLFDPASSPSDLRKRLRPLVDNDASAACCNLLLSPRSGRFGGGRPAAAQSARRGGWRHPPQIRPEDWRDSSRPARLLEACSAEAHDPQRDEEGARPRASHPRARDVL